MLTLMKIYGGVLPINLQICPVIIRKPTPVWPRIDKSSQIFLNSTCIHWYADEFKYQPNISLSYLFQYPSKIPINLCVCKEPTSKIKRRLWEKTSDNIWQDGI